MTQQIMLLAEQAWSLISATHTKVRKRDPRIQCSLLPGFYKVSGYVLPQLPTMVD